MTIKNRTKELFAEHLYKVLMVKPYEKIQVKDICESCQASRQTFYYHFKDKYDLVAWIFMQDYESGFQNADSNNYILTMTQMLERIYLRRSFYKQVFTEHSQNSLTNYIQDFDVEMGIKVICEYYKTESVTDEQLYYIKYHSYGSIQMTIEWLLHSQKMTAEEFARLYYESMPAFLREAYVHSASTKFCE